MENLWYLCTVLIHVHVASPDPNPRGGNYLTLRVQFYANECNEGETLTPNPKEYNSMLTSGTSGGGALCGALCDPSFLSDPGFLNDPQMARVRL